MSTNNQPLRPTMIHRSALPALFPTDQHSPEFWEALGRAVASFGFLEEFLGKAIFAFTGTREIPAEQAEEAFEQWLPTLERALIDPLGKLITSYEEAVRAHPDTTITNLDDLLDALRLASKYRNALCHGSWRAPDAQGRSQLFFVDNKKQVWDAKVDVAFLNEVQAKVAELICGVVNTVTTMGWQFPGTGGPGRPLIPQTS